LLPLLLDVAFVASSSFSTSFFEELELKLEFKDEGMIDPFAIFAINAIPFSLVVSSSLAISPSRSLSSTDIAFNLLLLLLLLLLFFKELDFPEGGVVVDPLEDATSIVLAFPANVRIARMFALIEEEEEEFDPHILLLFGLSERWSEADVFFSSSLMFASLVVAFGGVIVVLFFALLLLSPLPLLETGELPASAEEAEKESKEDDAIERERARSVPSSLLCLWFDPREREREKRARFGVCVGEFPDTLSPLWNEYICEVSDFASQEEGRGHFGRKAFSQVKKVKRRRG
jgi:hypothetical protein